MAAAPNFDAIPADLKALPQWVLWRIEERKGKLTKVPYTPWGSRADSTDRRTWSAFSTVLEAFEKGGFDGIGFVFQPPYAGLDCDKCILEDGTIKPRGREIVKRLDSYTEISPSGKGVHVIAKGQIPRGRKKGAFEMYQTGRFFTITGDHLDGTPTTIEDRPEEIKAVYDELFGEPVAEPDALERMEATGASADLTDDQIISLAEQAANGPKFKQLMAGAWEALGYPSQSEADGALVAILAFYSRDKEQILRIVRRSELWDEKWEREDYQERTIGGALELVKENYNGNGKEARPAGERSAPIDPEIKEKALAIAIRGDPFKFFIWQAQRNHLGDISYQKVLICSMASAASLTSHGIQPGGTGDKGSGKSDACVAAYHLVPMDRRLDGSLSPMSLFYLQKKGHLRPGMILFSDDIEYEGIIPIYKRSTARFQHGATHYTVSSGKNRVSEELIIPPRLVWWLTSVESVANEQAFDRQYPISTDSNPSHKKRVSKEIAARRARKELMLAVDEGILVARAILADIFEHGPFQVVIPQADKAEWIKSADFRGQEQFWDLVDALAILRWRQREIDADGWLIAADQDLIEAKDIMMSHKVAHISDLTEAEVKVVGVLTDGLPHTQKEITEALGIAQSTLSERLKSIVAKSAIITEDYEHGKKFYSINPKMNLNASYWQNLKLIDLEIDGERAYRSQQIALSACYRYVIGLFIGIIINNSNRIPSSLSANLGGCIEGSMNCDFCEICPLAEKLNFTIYTPGQNTDNALFGPDVVDSDTDKSGDNPPITDKSVLPMVIESDKKTDKDMQLLDEQSKDTVVPPGSLGEDELFLTERCLRCGAPCGSTRLLCSRCEAGVQKTEPDPQGTLGGIDCKGALEATTNCIDFEEAQQEVPA